MGAKPRPLRERLFVQLGLWLRSLRLEHPVTRASLVTVTVLLLFLLNPFGLKDASQRHSDNLVLNFSASFYHARHQNDITVLLLDDQYLRDYAKRYPVAYPELSQLLSNIALLKPRMLFLDFFQHHIHSDGFESWLATLQRLEQGGLNVVMGRQPWYCANQGEGLPQRLAEVGVRYGAVAWRDEEHYYPSFVTAKIDNDICQTELTYPSAAMAIYGIDSELARPGWLAQQRAEGEFSNALVVRWPDTAPDKQNVFFSQGKCSNAPSAPLLRSIKRIWHSFGYGVSNADSYQQRNQQECPPYLSLSAATLLAPGALGHPEVQAAIRDRFVLIGYGFTGSADLVLTPLHGTLPGVYYHAAALENLLTYQQHYWRVPEDVMGSNLNLADLLEGILQTLVLFAVMLFRFRYLEQSPALSTSELSRYAVWLLLIVFALVAMSLALSIWGFRYGLVNWYVYMMIFFISLPTLLQVLRMMLQARTARLLVTTERLHHQKHLSKKLKEEL
ncbi:CHASE2 domain-containing protein [Aliagarivorans marinus]|uniref:CHASE2 domain-containing protein n=1 Tax=Aliagarivorans marinus TaxID=561965 RepID=UPI00040A7819|nr:CHASE2 domain-containing protein [Aliagarivorans marinus]